MNQNINVAVIHSTHGAIVDRLRTLLPDSFSFIGAEEATPVMGEADMLVTSIKFPAADQLPRVRWIHLLSAGTEHVPAATINCSQWVLTHGGGPSAVPIAEWCMMMMLYFARRMPTILDYQARRDWFRNRIQEFTSNVLRGKTVGIVGYGALGREVGRLCKAFGMKVVASVGRQGKTMRAAYHTVGTGDPEGMCPDEWFALDDLPEVLPRMDFIVLGLRLAPETTGIINRQTLSRVKSTGILLNPSRGGLVDEAALIDVLKSRRLAGAALDVFHDEPLPENAPIRDAPNIVISPHCSAETQFFRDEIVQLIASNLQRFAAGEQLLNMLAR